MIASSAGAQAPDSLLRASRKPMKELLAQGFEIRSHQFYRCTNHPDKDDAVSCVNVLMQKGAVMATCSFDRDRFLFPTTPMNAECTVLE